tara:strand:+ start:484 stop:747 length:264 start_codon:yes stop_codon:yes gene_type:complete
MHNFTAKDNDIEFSYNETYDMLAILNPILWEKIEDKIENLYQKNKQYEHAMFDAECDVLHGQGYTLTDDCEWVKKIYRNYYIIKEGV